MTVAAPHKVGIQGNTKDMEGSELHLAASKNAGKQTHRLWGYSSKCIPTGIVCDKAALSYICDIFFELQALVTDIPNA